MKAIQIIATISCMLAILLGCSNHNSENNQVISESAMAYVEAYINQDFNRLKLYYDDSSTFQDPTLALIDSAAALPVTGPIKIIEKLHRNFNGVRDGKYKLVMSYSTGDLSVFVGTYAYTQNATAFGGPNQDIQFALKSTTILKEKEGKIIEHIEYMDYASWFEQYNSQLIK